MSDCHMPYSKEKKQLIFELYLFINPIGFNCYQCEQEILSFMQDSEYKVHIHFVTFHNFNTVTQHMRRLHLNEHDIDLRNELYESIYDASLAYKAALLQGKKLGRAFLVTLQNYISVQKRAYSKALLDLVIHEVGLDAKLFYEDKSSSKVKEDYENDQRIAHEMNIEQVPTLVLFTNEEDSDGLKMDRSIITADLLNLVCGHATAVGEVPYHPIELNNWIISEQTTSTKKDNH